MGRAAKAGFLYFALVFALGFLFGTIRTLLVAPWLGTTSAVLAELPIMLAASWVICGLVLRRLPVAAKVIERLVMGATAFVLLILAETALGTILIGRSLAEQLRTDGQADATLRLGAQLAFAAFPLLRKGRPPEPIPVSAGSAPARL